MAVRKRLEKYYEGLSTDDKPTGVPSQTIFKETDTGRTWITYDSGDNWIVVDKRVRLVGEGGAFIPGPQYRVPFLRSANNGVAEWSREQARYGQWTAKLTGGVQSEYDDYASVSWNEDKPFLKDLREILWVYRMSAEEVAAPNVAIHVHDPDHPERRADISLSHTQDDLGKTVGWHEFSLVDAVYGLFYYGNEIPGACELVAHGVAGDLYTLAQFKADPVFSTYVISRITIEWGYYSAGTFDAVHIAKVEVNGEDIPLVPSAEETLKDSVPYEFSINGVNFNGYAGIKTLMLEAIADNTHFTTLHHYNVAGNKVDYVVPTGKVFIAYQALVWAANVNTIGRIGESVNADGAASGGNGDGGISKDVLFLGNGTVNPFMVACYGVFSAGKYVTASAVDANDLKQHTTLFGVERDA